MAGTSGGGSMLQTLTGNSGGAVPPTLNNINTLGTGSITIVGSPGTSTLTTQLTGLTNHSLLVGAGTATITNLGVASNGQLPIGSTGADPVLATITAGTNISVTNGAGSITIAATGFASFSWINVTTATQSMAVNKGYISNDGATLVTFTLPSTAAIGDMVAIQGSGTGLWTIAQNAGQTIHFNAVNSTAGAGGSVSSTSRYDSITLLCIAANTDFAFYSGAGNYTVV